MENLVLLEATATGDGSVHDLKNYEDVKGIFVVSGFTGTFSFLGSVDGSTWYTLPFYAGADGTEQLSIQGNTVGNGVFTLKHVPRYIKSNVSAYTAGPIKAYLTVASW